MIIFFSGTGKIPTVEKYQEGIDVMMTFYDMYDKPLLPKFKELYKARKRQPEPKNRPRLTKGSKKRENQ
jgi:hypothetical protein